MSPLLTAASCLAERIKVNTMRRETRDGRPFWIKRRRRSALFTLACANQFFRLADNPVRALASPPEWQRWEVKCFHRLHGDEFRAFAAGTHGVAAEELPGTPLALHLDRHTLTPPMVAAAARELRRAHEMTCPELPGGWTHGDPHTGNFLHDDDTGRARLIDFEVMHDPAVPAAERRADDLLVFLQDLVGRATREQWLPLASAFLEGYDDDETIARLLPRLILPRGIPRLWWAVRTSYLPGAELAHRLELLRETAASPVTAA
jgi:hypothetical protein